jgi:hypothetical protein
MKEQAMTAASSAGSLAALHRYPVKHNQVQVGVYASVVQPGLVHIDDTVSVA